MADGMDLGAISFRITASADGIQAAFDEATGAIEDFLQAQTGVTGGADKMGKTVSDSAGKAGSALRGMGADASKASAANVAAFAAIAAAAAKGMGAVVSAIDKGVAAYNNYVSAAKGLQSVGSFKGIDTSALQTALKGLEDQFLDTASASTALKNLLARGYSLEQAVQTITRLKDAAAYGRQANYDMAEAVVSATEGLKNENSILVNAA